MTSKSIADLLTKFCTSFIDNMRTASTLAATGVFRSEIIVSVCARGVQNEMENRKMTWTTIEFGEIILKWKFGRMDSTAILSVPCTGVWVKTRNIRKHKVFWHNKQSLWLCRNIKFLSKRQPFTVPRATKNNMILHDEISFAFAFTVHQRLKILIL